MKRLKKYTLIGLGSISLAFGFVGVFLPLLPTTPFLLLTAYCYLKSSEKLYHWLLNHPRLGPYLSSYIHHRAIHRRTRIVALSTLWPTILFSAYLAPLIHVKIALVTIAGLVTWHLMTLKVID